MGEPPRDKPSDWNLLPIVQPHESSMQLPSPNEDYFQLARAPRAMRAAVEALSLELDKPLTEMERHTMGELSQLALDHYGDELPFFWKNWIDWCRSEGPQPMGEL